MGLRDLVGELGDRVEAMPAWAKGVGVLAGLYGVGRLMGQCGPAQLEAKHIVHLPRFRLKPDPKVKVTRWLLDELQREGTLSLDEIAVMLDIGYWETGMQPRAVSPVGAPDDKGGRSWGVLQLLADTIRGLGADIVDVSPRRNGDGTGPVSDAELERATRGSARVAVLACTKVKPGWARPRHWLGAVRYFHRDDALAAARQFFVRWQAGPARRWADIERVAPNRTLGSLGLLHYSVPKRLSTLPDFRRALGLDPLEDELLGWVRTTPWGHENPVGGRP